MIGLTGIRRKDKEITDAREMHQILKSAKFVTVAMCAGDEPYLVTLSHGYDETRNCLYFHCAQEGKKVDVLRANSHVWGQALLDHGYVQGSCDHLYATIHFKGTVTFIEDTAEKTHALRLLIESLDENPAPLIAKKVTAESVQKVVIGRIDINYLTGKKADKIV